MYKDRYSLYNNTNHGWMNKKLWMNTFLWKSKYSTDLFSGNRTLIIKRNTKEKRTSSDAHTIWIYLKKNPQIYQKALDNWKFKVIHLILIVARWKFLISFQILSKPHYQSRYRGVENRKKIQATFKTTTLGIMGTRPCSTLPTYLFSGKYLAK